MAQHQQSKELATAIQAAEAAATICRAGFGRDLAVTTKKDKTPVTQVDVDCEQAIREIILDRFPDHDFFGEESGRTGEGGEHVWLVDPIDGTKSFIRGYPFFSTQIALMRGSDIVLGVSCGTMFDELAWAERGSGAWLNGVRLRVSDVADPGQATISTGNLRSLAKSDGWQRLGELVARSWRTRGYGDFYHYHLLASGKIEAVIESDVDILDIAAVSVIVEEAGGIFTDMNGRRPGLQTRSVLAANPPLHSVYVARLEGFVE